MCVPGLANWLTKPTMRSLAPVLLRRKLAAGGTTITVVGNLVADPELRFTPSGAAVANFTVASTPRTFDRQTEQWKDGDALFLRCSIWREAAENVAESLTKGARVIADRPNQAAFLRDQRW